MSKIPPEYSGVEQIAYTCGRYAVRGFVAVSSVKFGYRGVKKFIRYSHQHALKDRSEDAITQNVFECLDFID